MHTKKYRASPLTDKKKSNSVRRRKKNIEQTENLHPPPPHQISNGPSLISLRQKLHILSSAHRTHGPAHLNVFICQTHVLHQCKYTALTFHIFGSFNAMKTKIPRSIQCNNMSSFIAIVLVDVNYIIAIYEL